MTRFTFATLVLLALPALPAAAQNPQQRPAVPAAAAGQIRGRVTDAATGRPLDAVSVAVWAQPDSVLAGGAVTGADGTFRVQGLAPGRYVLRVARLGYAAGRSGEVVVETGAVQAPPLALQPGAVQLEALTVTGERSEVAFSADRNTYEVKNMPSTAGATAAEVLQNVPAVEVDQDGRVSLRGNDNVAVQINGRAAPVRGEQLGRFLQQLPAGMIERVEVIPNPSARYDPEGMSGIVNIILKADAGLGLSGGLAVGGGTSDRYNGTGNLGYGAGALTLFGSYGYFTDSRDTHGFTHRTNLLGGAPLDDVWQNARGGQTVGSHTLSGSAEYKFGAQSSLAATLLASDFGFERDTRTAFSRMDAGGAPLERSDDLQRLRSDNFTLDGTLSFRRVVRPRQNELQVEARFNRTGFTQENGFLLQPLAVDGSGLAGLPVESRDVSEAPTRELYLQADATRMLAGVRVETGAKSQLRRVVNDLSAQRLSADGWVDTGASNRFSLDEWVHAGYGVFSRAFGKLEAQGGLRLEYTSRSTSRASDELRPFTDLFPSALVAYNLTETRQVKASYSRRIVRPQTQMLNSFLFYEDPLNRFQGNPYLRPEYTDAWELGFQQSGDLGSIQVNPFYRHTTGAIRRVRTVQGDTTTSTVANLATADSYGADFNASLRTGPLNGFLGFSAFRQRSDGDVGAGTVTSDGFSWSLRGNATVRLSPRTDVQAYAMYRAPTDVEQGRIGSVAIANLTVRQKFMDDRASVSVRVQDVFGTMGYTMRTEDPAYVLDTERHFGVRGASLTFSYSFGQAPRIRQPRVQEPQPDPSTPVPGS
jgi:ferric enterobactin receptor